MKQRGINTVRATITRSTNYRLGEVTVMTHPAYGERHFPNSEVENRITRGWVVVESNDPTKPKKRGPGRPPKKPVEE